MHLRLATLAAAVVSAGSLQLGAIRNAPNFMTHTAPRAVKLQMKAPANVGEAKDAFFAAYGKPVGPMAQGFVSEMIQGNCFAMQSPSYTYTPIFAVGYEALCKEFLQSCPSDEDRELIRSSLASALGMDAAELASDASSLLSAASGLTEAQLLESSEFKAIADKGAFKYTYTFGAGLVALMGAVGVEPTDEAFDRWCDALKTSSTMLKRDYSYYKSSMEKLVQAKELMVQMQVSAKKNEAKRLAEKAAQAAKEAEEAERVADEATPAA